MAVVMLFVFSNVSCRSSRRYDILLSVDAALYEIVDFLDVDVLPSDVLDVGSFGLNNLFESVPNVVSLENSDVDYPE
jgi:hypothetical protein